jgi:hypothetical protein
MNNQEGGSNVVDDWCGIGNFVASGVDQWLHDGRGHSFLLVIAIIVLVVRLIQGRKIL